MVGKKMHGPVRFIDPGSAEGKKAIKAAEGRRRFSRLMEDKIIPARKPPIPEGSHESGMNPTHSYAPKNFGDWLSVYFISLGYYRITDRGFEELSRNLGKRQFTDFAEHITSRKGEERSEKRGLDRAQKRELVDQKIKKMLRDGDAGHLYQNGYLTRPPHLDWKDESVRIDVIKKFIEFLGKSPKEAIFGDFRTSGLSGMLSHYYRNSPYLALAAAGYAHDPEEIVEHSEMERFSSQRIYPWEQVRVGNELYKDRTMRIAAIRWLSWKMEKAVTEITYDDFAAHGLSGLLSHNAYHDSIYLAFAEAGYAFTPPEAEAHSETGRFESGKPYPWEFFNSRIYHEESVRVAATRWLIWNMRADPRSLTQDDFTAKGLGGLIQIYRGSPYDALVESGHAWSRPEAISHSRSGNFGTQKIYPWQMNNIRIYADRKMRIAAVKWLLHLTGKQAREITSDDFTDAGMQGLLSNKYGGSPFKALFEAGLVRRDDEEYMRRRGAGRFA